MIFIQIPIYSTGIGTIIFFYLFFVFFVFFFVVVLCMCSLLSVYFYHFVCFWYWWVCFMVFFFFHVFHVFLCVCMFWVCVLFLIAVQWMFLCHKICNVRFSIQSNKTLRSLYLIYPLFIAQHVYSHFKFIVLI